MEVQRIKTEGRRIDPPRDVERLWLALTTKSQNGCTIEGHLVQPGGEPTRIEVYVDKLPDVLQRVRTDADKRAHETALLMHANAHKEECRRRKVPEGTDLGMDWNGCPEIHLTALGYRTGLPPIETCQVLHPQDPKRTMDAREWSALPEDKRREWLVPAPPTPLNMQHRANDHLAEVIARALSDRSNGKQR